jgi:hypothetical protein
MDVMLELDAVMIDALRAGSLTLRRHEEKRYGFQPDGSHTYAPPRLAVMAQLPGVKITIHNITLSVETQAGVLKA